MLEIPEKFRMRPNATTLALLCLLAATSVRAQTPADLLVGYEAAARQAGGEFAGFSAERGRALYRSAPRGDWSCATCHTDDPAQPGRHVKTDKPIAPLAPAANPERFTRPEKVEKWFRRNCNDVLGRECTPLEKGDLLTYLLSIEP